MPYSTFDRRIRWEPATIVSHTTIYLSLGSSSTGWLDFCFLHPKHLHSDIWKCNTIYMLQRDFLIEHPLTFGHSWIIKSPKVSKKIKKQMLQEKCSERAIDICLLENELSFLHHGFKLHECLRCNKIRKLFCSSLVSHQNESIKQFVVPTDLWGFKIVYDGSNVMWKHLATTPINGLYCKNCPFRLLIFYLSL